ncbi:MAG: hypothetical protein ACREUZ_06010 [Burkholderiales bacterium]
MIGRWLLWLLVALGVAAELARPPEAGPVSLAFFGAIFTAIVAVFGYIADKAVTVAITIAQAAIMIGQAIGQFALLTASVFAKVFGFLRSFWSGVLRPFITWSWDQIQRFSGWLKRTLEPVLKFLQDLRTEITKIYDRWLRPIFDTIDTTRRILQVLATLRVPFARELDQELAQLEQRLLGPILDLYRRLNEAMDWVNRIITLDGLLQRLTLLRSLVRDIYSVAGIWQNAFSNPVTNTQYEQRRRQAGAVTMVDVQRNTAEVLTTGSGPYAPFVDEWSAIWRAELEGR